MGGGGGVCDDAGGGGGVVDVEGRLVCMAVCGLLLAFYEAEEVGLAAVEVGVFEVPGFGISVALQDALLQMRNFVKPVHVQLAHEGRKLLVLEPAPEHLARELFMVEDCGGWTDARAAVVVGCGWAADGKTMSR